MPASHRQALTGSNWKLAAPTASCVLEDLGKDQWGPGLGGPVGPEGGLEVGAQGAPGLPVYLYYQNHFHCRLFSA